jgi:hypothetical protein
LFKRGEIIELDISDGKRTLVHEGYVFRRIRSETNWHGWYVLLPPTAAENQAGFEDDIAGQLHASD